MEDRCQGSDVVKGMATELDCKYQPLVENNTILLYKKPHREAKSSKRRCRTAIKTCGLVTLAAFFCFNLTAFVVYWCTTFVNDSIIQGLVIENNTKAYEWWISQPEHPHLQVRLFNYTNADRFLEGECEKLEVEEVGPYTYRETMERVNVVFHPNGTVSYQEKRSFEFVPSASAGRLDDIVVVPNMVLLSSASIMKESSYFSKVGMSILFKQLDVQPFHTLRVEDYFWGYNDSLFETGKAFQPKSERDDPTRQKKMGLLVSRNGTSPVRISIYTGATDITLLGVIDRYSGKNHMPHWSGDECNRIDGTDGSMFPPHLVGEDAVLHMYIRDMCRKFPLVFKEYVQAASGVPAMRFQPPLDVFSIGASYPENACYCHPDVENCPPAGVFNASPCAFNAPIMYSFPHFYLGDPVLLEMVDGLKPDPVKHSMFLDIHPEFGFPVGGESRFQVNIMVRKSSGITRLDGFEDNTILPIVWFEVIVDSLAPDVDSALKMLAFLTHTMKRIILVTFIVTLLLVLAVTLHYARKHYHRNNKCKVATVDDTRQQELSSRWESKD